MSKSKIKQSIKSIRLPDVIWSLLKRNANKNYRSLNSHLLKIIEDWLVEHDYIDDNERTKSE